MFQGPQDLSLRVLSVRTARQEDEIMEKRRVKIESGELQGIFGYDPRITVFKGVPYAKAPVGALRWRAPQPVDPWKGVRLAAEYGPMSIQNVPGLDPKEFWTKELHPAGPEFEMSEDCLYLNIFTPAKKGDEKLPVLIYIHGGGLMGGYPYEIEFDWEHMARKGIVVVTVAYRLGLFGFFSHPELSKEAPEDPKGSYGYLDQMTAIRWTYKNIEAFGGDPEKITIAGQSAGAGSVLTQLSSPSSAPYFRAAIVQSGIIMPFSDVGGKGRNVTVEEAEKAGAAFFEAAGIASLEEARAMDAVKLHELNARLMKEGKGFRSFAPVDGIFQMETSTSAMLNDHWGNKPVIFGYTSGELKMFNRFAGGSMPKTLEELEKCADAYGEQKEEFLKAAACTSDEDVQRLMDSDAYTSMVVSTYLAGKIRCAQGHRTYLYEFDVDIPGEDNPGVYHGAELPFAYDALARMWRPYQGYHYDMARIVSSYWVNFIKTGDPNGLSVNGEELPRWDAFCCEAPKQMKFTRKAEERDIVIDEIMKLREKVIVK